MGFVFSPALGHHTAVQVARDVVGLHFSTYGFGKQGPCPANKYQQKAGAQTDKTKSFHLAVRPEAERVFGLLFRPMEEAGTKKKLRALASLYLSTGGLDIRSNLGIRMPMGKLCHVRWSSELRDHLQIHHRVHTFPHHEISTLAISALVDFEATPSEFLPLSRV